MSSATLNEKPTHLVDSASPQVQPVNTVTLNSIEDSKIRSVSVYSGLAEIKRVFKFNVKTGQNQVQIIGLSKDLRHDSLRVEGQGSATIHDVSISIVARSIAKSSSPELDALLSKEKKIQKALIRTEKSISSLETYVASVKVDNIEVSHLRSVVQEYDATAEELDDKVTTLETELNHLKRRIKEEKDKLAGPTGNEKLNMKATIGIFADFEGGIEITLIYAVYNSTWNAGYEIRVNTQTKEKPVNLIYKASIIQSTGEDWDDVPLTLETARPTYGVGLPTLTPWSISVRQKEVKKSASKGSTMFSRGGTRPPAPVKEEAEESDDDMGFGLFDDDLPALPQIQHRGLQVSSTGGVSATFGVPGLITIPSDGAAHNVTIVRLELDATMSWVSIPKKDAGVHINAKIKNASEYTLLPGNTSVYVDGSFISKSNIPLVSPEETFSFPLGLDPAIRVVYHPRTKNATQSGFYLSKSSTHTFTQRITVHNTKATSSGIEPGNLDIKIIDQVPVSEDSTVTVKLLNPSLVLPSIHEPSAIIAGGKGVSRTHLAPVKVSPGVTANWNGANEVGEGATGVDISSFEKDGKFCWNCSVFPQKKVGLVLQWEVTYPVGTDILGL